MKWILGVEKNEIDMKIVNDEFILETPTCKIQFDMNYLIAKKMSEQFKSVVTPPYIQKEGFVLDINGKQLLMDFVLGSRDYWTLNFVYGSETFYSELTNNDINRMGTVLDDYLSS